jgi:hypothetical protein
LGGGIRVTTKSKKQNSQKKIKLLKYQNKNDNKKEIKKEIKNKNKKEIQKDNKIMGFNGRGRGGK